MYKYLIWIACVMFIYSCSEEKNEPVTSDSTIPGQVSNVRVEPLPGAVKLTYDMPAAGQSLSYVKAECLINGVVRQVKASSYTNTLTIEGFADDSEYTVNLYSVNRSEKASEPVTVPVKPLTPDFREVLKNLQLVETFGGAMAVFNNPNEANLAINMIYMDSYGVWNHVETMFTKTREGRFAVHGFEPVETKFGVFIVDRWNNYSDTLICDLIPIFEKQLDKSKFREMFLPGDCPTPNALWSISLLWDGNLSSFGYHSSFNFDMPIWFTFDLGADQVVPLNRFKLWQTVGYSGVVPYYLFTMENVRYFELWGSLDPNPDGSWDSWTLLIDGEVIQREIAEENYDGDEYFFPEDVPLVRYIRFKCKEAWGQISYFCLSEVAFFGAEPSDVLDE